MLGKGYNFVIVPEGAYCLAKKLAKLGLEENIGKAFAKVVKEYAKKREELIKELQSVKVEWNQLQICGVG
ncbi:MAG: hypothetical protein ACUVXA_14670 [Candidatus Jordarchaeum sp.]|uniref:hypothetical protein n=1 Tax=Candidatus Jordarchaeum sp. TaxID=2823881 RepID=UPI00404B1501